MAAEMMYRECVKDFAATLNEVEFTDYNNHPCNDAIETVCRLLKQVKSKDGKAIVVGNGGSAAIASHTAIDLTKNARIPALAFNDPAALTCLANDYGYQRVFAKQIGYHGKPNDLLLAISSSGMSANIINAVDEARHHNMLVVTFSGFAPDNRLRGSGNYNFYVPSARYGAIELAHMTILHFVIDMLVMEHELLEAVE